MKLLCSPTSPFSSKVRMAARYLELDITEIRVDTNAGPAILVDNNPLGKIPTLLTKDGRSIFDSRAITQYFNRIKGKRLYPAKDRKRTEVEILEALCDGACDCLLSIIYERRFRSQEMIFEPWIDRQWAKAKRTLDQLSADVPKIGKKLHAGHFAMAAMLGYLQLRFEGEWEHDHSELVGWLRTFEKKFPDFPALKPRA
jgi:glutathione S-transferase